MSIPDTFYEEEVRCDYTVSAKMKKIWAVELEILERFDAVCKQYGLTYYADFGTLLGAVRHKGFIPWDDDIDVTMMREDYEAFKRIAHTEFEEPYIFQNAYNCPIRWGFSKIRDGRTSAVEHLEYDASFNQGIFLDIFPLDPADDGSAQSLSIVQMAAELWTIANGPEDAVDSIRRRPHRILDDGMLEVFGALPKTDVLAQMELFLESNKGKSSKINYIADEVLKLVSSRDKKDYDEVIWMPFEHTTVPVPVGYDSILRAEYGDYTVPVQGGSCHTDIIMDPDNPYTMYINK